MTNLSTHEEGAGWAVAEPGPGLRKASGCPTTHPTAESVPRLANQSMQLTRPRSTPASISINLHRAATSGGSARVLAADGHGVRR